MVCIPVQTARCVRCADVSQTAHTVTPTPIRGNTVTYAPNANSSSCVSCTENYGTTAATVCKPKSVMQPLPHVYAQCQQHATISSLAAAHSAYSKR